MRIAYVHNLEIEIDSRSQKEVSSLIKAGHRVLFCGWNKEKDSSIEAKIIVTRGQKIEVQNICYEVKKGAGLKENFKPLVKYELALIKWLLKNRNAYDVIHGCSLDVLLVTLPIAKLFRKKVVYDIYDDYADSHSVGNKLYRILKRIDKFILKKTDVVIICSEKRLEQLATNEIRKLVVIHNTPDIASINSRLMPTNSNNKLKVAYVGNLNDGRLVFEMAKMISEKNNMEFYCGGSGLHEKEIKKLAELHDNIFFYGRLSYEQTLSLESNCDVIPALYDPGVKNHKFAAPNKFYEALYLGKPTIMAHNTGMDNFVDENNTGITVDFNIEDIECALDRIFDNLDDWKQNKDRIKGLYFDNFSWEIMENRLLSIYDSFER